MNHLADNLEPIAEPFYDEGPLLHTAAKYGLTEVLDRLSQKASYYDSSPNLKPPNSDGDAVEKHDPEFDKLNQVVLPILHTACTRALPNLKTLKVLVEKCNVDANARSQESQSKDGNLQSTALHCLAFARSSWQLEGIRYLVEKGADINSTNESGQTPLYIASMGYVLAVLLFFSLLSTLPYIDPHVDYVLFTSTKLEVALLTSTHSRCSEQIS